MKTNIHLPEHLRELAKKHFVMLESHSVIKKCDTLQLRISGYADVMYLISDIVKTCILALNDGGSNCNPNIAEPDSNISGVLGIILDLVPYEEAELLDKIRESLLNPSGTESQSLKATHNDPEHTDEILTKVQLLPEYNFSSIRILNTNPHT